LLRSGRGLAVVVNRDGMLGCSNQMLFSTDTVTFLKYGVTVKRAAEARWNVSLPGVSIADRISERFRAQKGTERFRALGVYRKWG
jgi:hypothetical protein